MTLFVQYKLKQLQILINWQSSSMKPKGMSKGMSKGMTCCLELTIYGQDSIEWSLLFQW